MPEANSPGQYRPGHNKPNITMNISSPSRLPQALSPTPPTFASKADYLGFVQEWKAVYHYLSLSIRTARLGSRLRPNNRPEKKASLEKELVVLGARLAVLGPCPYVQEGAAYGSHRVPLGSSAATWLLGLRAAAKLDAGRRRAGEIAGRAMPTPGAAGCP